MHSLLISYLQKFKILNSDEKLLLQQSFQMVRYKTGDVLSAAGKVTRHLYFINEGILKITIPAEQSRDHAYYFMEQNQFMSFLYSLYGNIPAEQGLEAACDSVIMQIDRKNLYLLFDKIPFFKSLIDEIAHLTMVEMINMKNIYLSARSGERYTRLMEHQPSLILHVPLIDIASYLGITAPSLSRIRRAVR